MKNFQLYARILRLVTDFEEHCRLRAVQGGQDPDDLRNVVRDVIYPDRKLVWC